MQGDVDWDIWTLLVRLSAQPSWLTSIQSTCSLLTKSFSGALAYYVRLLWRNKCSLTLRFHFKSEFLCPIISPRTVFSPYPHHKPSTLFTPLSTVGFPLQASLSCSSANLAAVLLPLGHYVVLLLWNVLWLPYSSRTVLPLRIFCTALTLHFFLVYIFSSSSVISSTLPYLLN